MAKITQRVKVDDVIENFDANAIYQIQNQSYNSIKIFQGIDEKYLILEPMKCFLYSKGSLDYYIEPYAEEAYVNYWKLED